VRPTYAHGSREIVADSMAAIITNNDEPVINVDFFARRRRRKTKTKTHISVVLYAAASAVDPFKK
jgi:hypothetical protein